MCIRDRILFDANIADEFHRAELFGAEILELCVEVGGTITGEHGVGLHKMGSLVAEHGNDAIDLMRSVKQALDPKHILNPGKIFHL